MAQEVRIFVVASSVMFSFAKQLILKWPVVITCFNCYLVFTATSYQGGQRGPNKDIYKLIKTICKHSKLTKSRLSALKPDGPNALNFQTTRMGLLCQESLLVNFRFICLAAIFCFRYSGTVPCTDMTLAPLFGKAMFISLV